MGIDYGDPLKKGATESEINYVRRLSHSVRRQDRDTAEEILRKAPPGYFSQNIISHWEHSVNDSERRRAARVKMSQIKKKDLEGKLDF